MAPYARLLTLNKRYPQQSGKKYKANGGQSMQFVVNCCCISGYSNLYCVAALCKARFCEAFTMNQEETENGQNELLGE